MGLKISVKIGNVTNLSDARYAAGMGVDYIGFNIDMGSEYYITASTFNEINNWISGIDIIGEIGANVPDNIDEYGPFLIETTNFIKIKKKFVFRINAKKIKVDKIENKLCVDNNVFFYILELTREQITNNIIPLSNLCKNYPIYISSDFDEALLDTITAYIRPKGIEIKGRLEDRPGFKEYDGIADVLEWLEEDN
jgi:phosphoribosylanthranilate isomerase